MAHSKNDTAANLVSSHPTTSSPNGKFTAGEVLGVIGLFCLCGALGGCRTSIVEEEANFADVPEYKDEDYDDVESIQTIPETHESENYESLTTLSVETKGKSIEPSISLSKSLSKSFSFSLSRSRSVDVNGGRYDSIPLSPQDNDYDPSSLSSTTTSSQSHSHKKRMIISRSLSTSKDPFDKKTGRSRIVRFMDDPQIYAAFPFNLSHSNSRSSSGSRSKSPWIDAFEIAAISVDDLQTSFDEAG